MRKLTLSLFILLCGLTLSQGKLHAQNPTPVPPDCVIFINNWTTAQSSSSFPNYFTACQTWTLQYTSVGFTALTLEVQSAPSATSSTAGTFVTYAGTVSTGINPNTNTSGRVSTFSNGLVDIPWIRVNLSGLMGSGTVFGVLYGYKTGYAGSGGGGGGAVTCGTVSLELCYNNAGAFGGVVNSSWDPSTGNMVFSFTDGTTPLVQWSTVSGPGLNSGIFSVNPLANLLPPATIGTSPGTDGGGLNLNGLFGGNTSIITTGVGGGSLPVNLQVGNGGFAPAAATASTGGAAGALTIQGGYGGDALNAANTGANVGGAGSSVFINSGGGGNTLHGMSNTGGNAGNVVVFLEVGGTGSTANGANGEFHVDGASTAFKVNPYSGVVTSTLLATTTNCSDSAGAAACGAAPAGSFVIDAASTSTVVSTTAVTANSQIFLQEDSSLSTRLSVTCNTQSSLTLGALRVTARTAGTSFTATLEAGPTTNPACISFFIVN